MVLAGMAVLVVYIVSAPRTVTLEDSGIFIMSSDVAGVSHPPGYPLHSLLGKLFSLLPFGSVAFRIHMLSAFFGALTCSVLFWIAHTLTQSRAEAYATALGYGVSREFWAESVIAEVYSLNTFIFFLLLALALRFVDDPRPSLLQWIALLLGLGLSHHWPLLLLSLPGVAVVLWPRRREIVRELPKCAMLTLLGLVPYLYLVARSNMDPPISFYGPIDSVDRFLYFVLRSGYAETDASPTAGWHDRLLFGRFLAAETVWQFTPLGAAVAGFGLARQWRRWPVNVAWGLVFAFAGGTLALLLLLRRDYGYLEQAVFKVYPLIAYGIMALWCGLGVAEVEAWLRTKEIAVPGAAAALAALLVGASLLANAKINFRTRYAWARDYAQTVLDAVDKNAIIVTTADADIGPIGYLNRVERVRPDVEIFNDKGLVFSNRLFRPPASDRTRYQAFRNLVDTTDRPVYVVGDLPLGYPTEDYGLFKKILRSGDKSLTVTPRVLEHCRNIASELEHTDMWTIEHRNVLLVDCGRLLGPVVHSSAAPERARYAEVLTTVSGHAYGKIGLLEGLAERGNPDDLLRWTDEAEKMLDPSNSKQATSRLLFIRGFLQHRKGLTADALGSFQRSVDIFPDARNGAVLGLLSLYAGQRMETDYRRLRETIFAGRAVPSTVKELDRTFGN